MGFIDLKPFSNKCKVFENLVGDAKAYTNIYHKAMVAAGEAKTIEEAKDILSAAVQQFTIPKVEKL